MSEQASRQQFIRNRGSEPQKPRIKIEYKVEVHSQTVQLPFVTGVLADLSGKPSESLPPLHDRQFIAINQGNLEALLKATKPRVAYRVPCTLFGEGLQLPIELCFESWDDFSPGSIAGRVSETASLLHAARG